MRLAFAAVSVAALIDGAAADAAPRVLAFEGTVVPSRTVVVANHVNGVVEDLRFSGGEDVAAGDILALIDPAEFEIALRAAKAALAEAEAVLRLAEDDAARQTQLLSRGTGSRVATLRAEVARDTALALRDKRRAEEDAAALALSRTQVSAPIDGAISPPRVTEGAFVEAKAGTALAEIVVLDPIRVAYRVPYADRTRALALAGAADPAELFERIRLDITLPSGARYPHAGRPLFESAAIDPSTDALTVWGLFANPNRTLVPGLAVTVHASIPEETLP
ncbi:efflux RND transporter periplasmic adaptor subunit [Acuticoccus sp. M5D2P5]|uniref:efflux RND transporter periplasmic adaptor subunit n=1 Tax=Acuticoccus kalidii TaxID=2910977 RepID=UPI001F2665A8|nr:efflux RND transporter periplasmic adaptor subunit [Acuticoccus kalidii]